MAIVLIFLILYMAQGICVPLSFAGLFAIILSAPCGYLERKGVPKGIAALISLLAALIVMFVVLYFISSQIMSFKNELPALTSQLQSSILDLENWAREKFNLSSDSMREMLHSATSQTLSHTTSLVSFTVSTLSGAVIYLVLIPIYTFLLLLYRRLIVQFLVASFQQKHTAVVYSVLQQTKHVIKGYVVGLLIEMVIVAIMNCAGFFILGVKYALLLGVIAAILNIIPYLGIFTACMLSILITYTTNGAATVLGVAITLVVVHLIDSNILLPKVVGSKVKINALVTILGVIVGSTLWGIPGMFLAVPIIAILKVIFDHVEDLKPWGLLLGDEPKPVKVLKKQKNLVKQTEEKPAEG
ncbi:AI-2E family transporter [Deminuibacter soli]|uniref:AI-2E family transporter n=2 Tax=Deminuibacter soli TaxID=2291815 RepID=A0A3E1NRV5_9BACT|nr:AI-2E family transporter [Deminuibacter soli]